jgi:hypothetical protein
MSIVRGIVQGNPAQGKQTGMPGRQWRSMRSAGIRAGLRAPGTHSRAAGVSMSSAKPGRLPYLLGLAGLAEHLL